MTHTEATSRAAAHLATGASPTDTAHHLRQYGLSFPECSKAVRAAGSNYERPSGWCRCCGGPASDGSDFCGEC